MMGDVFGKPSISVLNTSKAGERARTVLLFGDDLDAVPFLMVNTSQGNQQARIQVDATADGALYAIGCKGGLGTYDMEFIDGPYQRCEGQAPESLVTKYIAMNSINERRVRIMLFRNNSTAPVGTFVGILGNMAARMVDHNGSMYLSVGLNVRGSWQK